MVGVRIPVFAPKIIDCKICCDDSGGLDMTEKIKHSIELVFWTIVGVLGLLALLGILGE